MGARMQVRLQGRSIADALAAVRQSGAAPQAIAEDLRDAVEPCVSTMRAMAPRRTGQMAESIEARPLPTPLTGVTVGPSSRAFYAHMVEHGHLVTNDSAGEVGAGGAVATGGVKHVPAHPFARPAYHATLGEVMRRLRARFKARLRAAVAAAGGRLG